MKRSPGFTIIEILVALAVLVLIGTLGFSNIHDLQAHNRDSQLKTSVNATQYQLQAFFKVNKYYPKSLDNKTLVGLDPALLKDPSGIMISQPKSALSYETGDCDNAKCQRFTLSANLEKEPTYMKRSSDKLD